MEYSTCITDPHIELLINRLERVQPAAHWVTGEYQRIDNVTEIMAKLDRETREVRKS